MKLKSNQKYTFSIEVTLEAERSQDAHNRLQDLFKFIEYIDLSIEKITPTRSNLQNRSLHKLLSLTADEARDKGIDLRMIVREDMPIEITAENLKILWKKLQEALFGTKSTTELKRTGEIDIVYRNFNNILIERTKGELCLPPFPSKDEEFDK